MAAVAPGERPEADASVEETRKTPAWALYAHAVLGDDAAMGRLGRSLQDLVYLRSPAWAGHGVEALRRNPRPSALRWLAFWSRKAGTGKLLSDSAAALTALREELGLDADDVADLFLPTLGLDPAGERDLGAGCRAVLVDGAFELQRDDPTKPVPRKVQRNFDKLVSSLPRAREVAWNQLEAAMILERAWPRERWDALFGHNPLLREGMEHLLVVSEAEVLPAGRLPSGSGAVRVLHPLEAASATRAQWVHLTPPFPQLSRALEADVEAALASVAAEFETPIRGRVGKSVTFVVDGDGVQVDGRPMTEKILQEILCVCRSA